MQNFDYHTPTRLVFGKGVIEKLPEVMAQFGKKILLTYGGGSIKKIGHYQKVKELLKDSEIIELSGIQPNPKYYKSAIWILCCSLPYRSSTPNTLSPCRKNRPLRALPTL
ncbi:MAG: iron-containing alcohol dehydrogenase [Bacteroidales bacterium]|nr:iron-containing alcohol dehydrogenase [Bacteroidales bacterium]